MLLTDLINIDDLEAEIKAGYVNRRFHPEFSNLTILNYSDQCQFDNHWTSVTRLTRGIIYDAETGLILARPFPKFYNLGDETNAGTIDPDTEILGAFDKHDGSLGIRYTRPDGRTAIATRGSFESEQAIHATEWAWARGWPATTPGWTQLYEIIYPDNRIVLNYGDTDELRWLGNVEIDTGRFSPNDAWRFDGDTLRDVLAIPDRANAEGFVVWLDDTRAVKIKQADYLALHRIVSSLTPKEIWRQLSADTIREFVVALPDEFHKWAADTAEVISGRAEVIRDDVDAHMLHLNSEALETRKDQALWIQANVPDHLRGLMFSTLDGRDISDAVWRMVEPVGVTL